MQAVGVGQLDALGRPLGRHFAAQGFQHNATVGGVAQLMATAFDQQQAQTLQQRLMRLTQTGETEQTGQRLAQIADRFVRRDERQTRTFDRLLAVQPPQAITQRQRFNLLQHGSETVAHAVGFAQQACAAPDQLFKIVGRYAEADHLCVERQFLRCALQQFEQVFRRPGFTQRLAQILFTQCAGQQLQQTQVLIGLGRNTNRQIDHLPVAPVHPFGELHQTHTGGNHQIAGFGGTVRDGDALTEKGRALLLTAHQPGEVALGNQAISDQVVGNQLKCGSFIHSRPGHGYLLQSEFEHCLDSCAAPRRHLILVLMTIT